MADPLTPIHAITLIKTLTFSSRVCHLFTETTHKTLLSDGEARRRQTEVSASDDRCFPLLTRRLHRERRRPASKEARITTSAKTAADPQETNLAHLFVATYPIVSHRPEYDVTHVDRTEIRSGDAEEAIQFSLTPDVPRTYIFIESSDDFLKICIYSPHRR
ncbi:hypothetical protein BLNAU_1528 [Blattamonas nauphoetae]|uniref:Uncharacterized protein n=1 Tax=Blattamonas nauphoetae TaxID=2049346 RepID=A0ABQ9YIL3_9EUKA|nr:hypothetical protein BLNAU_24967 [Blattamonas nauphoetae]KAK2944689.1 hypothetical protein BLNAU_20382 [Blattamonas nauphoetae]KAK2963437.1 hypothetical protein BLNAU_1479 [Blattamonas nauphoetae]KAK2963485.1 hypothetical protein BLNAU_1528 [Blattamonas nauphoetae]